MRYLVIIEKGPKSYGAFSPDVPGCVAVDSTREKVEQRMQEALEFHLEGIVEDGDPIPVPHTSPDDPEIANNPTLTPIYMDIQIPHRAA
jgi:predicted RNase H-like HicB family nuclease